MRRTIVVRPLRGRQRSTVAVPLTGICRGCGDTLPRSGVGGLVFVNFCFHVEVSHAHSRCSGFRLLCSPCHLHLGSYDYYAEALDQMAEANPEQYPWDDCKIGLRVNLDALSDMVTINGLDPADEEGLVRLWLSRSQRERQRQAATLRTLLPTA